MGRQSSRYVYNGAFNITIMSNSNRADDNRPSSGRLFLGSRNCSTLNLKMHLTFWLTLSGGLGLDLLTKKAVFSWLANRPYNTFVIIDGFFQLVAVENTGAAFGIAAGRTLLLTIFSLFALIVVLGIFLFNKNDKILFHIALGLFAAGVCGNLYDRLFNEGCVRDFIDIVYWPGKHWPAFNLADSMLCIAVALLVITTLTTRKSL